MLSARRRYEAWVRDHSPRLYRLAYRLTGRADVAEDLLQETFLAAWRSRGRLRDPRRARAWLVGILRHAYHRWVREGHRRPDREAPPPPEDLTAPGEDLLERLSRGEELQAALDTLPDRFKEPLLLVLQGGLTCEETAALLGVPLGTVLSRIHRARRALRAALRRAGEAKGVRP